MVAPTPSNTDSSVIYNVENTSLANDVIAATASDYFLLALELLIFRLYAGTKGRCNQHHHGSCSVDMVSGNFCYLFGAFFRWCTLLLGCCFTFAETPIDTHRERALRCGLVDRRGFQLYQNTILIGASVQWLPLQRERVLR